LRSSSIFEKIEVVFHFWKNWGRLPFLKKLRSSRQEEEQQLLNLKKMQFGHKCRHENSWRHGRHASGTIGRKMKFGSFLIIASIYDYITASFSGITSILRLPKSWNSLNVCNRLTNHPFLLFLTLLWPFGYHGQWGTNQDSKSASGTKSHNSHVCISGYLLHGVWCKWYIQHAD
jgi:hypothetical protein